MNIAIYTRVSTADQSVEAQRLELAAYVKQRGWNITHELTDTMSGAKKERPGLDALMGLVRRKEVDAVLCVKLDRMGRSLAHFATLVEEFEQADVALICTSQGIDTSRANACGRLQMQVLAAVAQFERSLIQERTRAGLAVARASGKRLGRKSDKLPAEEAAREAIILEWRLATGGKDFRELARRLGGVNPATAWRLNQRIPKGPIVLEVE